MARNCWNAADEDVNLADLHTLVWSPTMPATLQTRNGRSHIASYVGQPTLEHPSHHEPPTSSGPCPFLLVKVSLLKFGIYVLQFDLQSQIPISQLTRAVYPTSVAFMDKCGFTELAPARKTYQFRITHLLAGLMPQQRGAVCSHSTQVRSLTWGRFDFICFTNSSTLPVIAIWLHMDKHMCHNQNPVLKWSIPRTILQELRMRISATISGWDCPLLTFIYPGFDCGSHVLNANLGLCNTLMFACVLPRSKNSGLR